MPVQPGILTESNYLKSTLFYLFLILLCLGSYWINSFVSILFFIILSSYHFGEQHLENKVSGTKFVNTIVYFTYGLLIFSLIFITSCSWNMSNVCYRLSTYLLLVSRVLFRMYFDQQGKHRTVLCYCGGEPANNFVLLKKLAGEVLATYFRNVSDCRCGK